MFTSARSRILAAALALGILGSAAPASAGPLGLDAGLREGSGDVLAVQYGYGGGRHHHHGGWGHHRHHGHHWGHHRGRHWGHHGGWHRHHHHHRGRHHGHW